MTQKTLLTTVSALALTLQVCSSSQLMAMDGGRERIVFDGTATAGGGAPSRVRSLDDDDEEEAVEVAQNASRNDSQGGGGGASCLSGAQIQQQKRAVNEQQKALARIAQYRAREAAYRASSATDGGKGCLTSRSRTSVSFGTTSSRNTDFNRSGRPQSAAANGPVVSSAKSLSSNDSSRNLIDNQVQQKEATAGGSQPIVAGQEILPQKAAASSDAQAGGAPSQPQKSAQQRVFESNDLSAMIFSMSGRSSSAPLRRVCRSFNSLFDNVIYQKTILIREGYGTDVLARIKDTVKAEIEAEVRAEIEAKARTRIEAEAKTEVDAKVKARIETKVNAKIKVEEKARIAAKIEEASEFKHVKIEQSFLTFTTFMKRQRACSDIHDLSAFTNTRWSDIITPAAELGLILANIYRAFGEAYGWFGYPEGSDHTGNYPANLTENHGPYDAEIIQLHLFANFAKFCTSRDPSYAENYHKLTNALTKFPNYLQWWAIQEQIISCAETSIFHYSFKRMATLLSGLREIPGPLQAWAIDRQPKCDFGGQAMVSVYCDGLIEVTNTPHHPLRWWATKRLIEEYTENQWEIEKALPLIETLATTSNDHQDWAQKLRWDVTKRVIEKYTRAQKLDYEKIRPLIDKLIATPNDHQAWAQNLKWDVIKRQIEGLTAEYNPDYDKIILLVNELIATPNPHQEWAWGAPARAAEKHLNMDCFSEPKKAYPFFKWLAERPNPHQERAQRWCIIHLKREIRTTEQYLSKLQTMILKDKKLTPAVRQWTYNRWMDGKYPNSTKKNDYYADFDNCLRENPFRDFARNREIAALEGRLYRWKGCKGE